MPREDAKANKKGRDSFSNECRVSDEEETAPPPSQRPTERQPLNEDNAAKRRVSPPALMSVGGGGGGRSKQPENGTVLFPFDSRFFCTISIAGSRNGCDDDKEDAGQGFHNTHTGRQGWARSARKVNEEGFFLLQKKSLEKDLG